jgi:hypothetical protein
MLRSIKNFCAFYKPEMPVFVRYVNETKNVNKCKEAFYIINIDMRSTCLGHSRGHPQAVSLYIYICYKNCKAVHRCMFLSFKMMWFKIHIQIQNADKMFVIYSSVQQMFCVASRWYVTVLAAEGTECSEIADSISVHCLI